MSQELAISLEQRAALDRAVNVLTEEFKGVFSRETVQRYVDDSLEALDGSRIRRFIPLFVNRFARDRLRALAQVEGRIAKDVPEVLFVCTHNAGRSQIAAALLDHLADGRVHVRSAGSEPGDEVNPVVVRALAEAGMDIAHEFPKPLTDEVVRAADVVITMGCGDSCPIYPGKRYMDWDVADPHGEGPAAVRAIVADIESRVRTLVSMVAVMD